MSTPLDAGVSEAALRHLPLAADILRQIIAIPAAHVDRPRSAGGDPDCGLSNHEGPRLELLRSILVEQGCVDGPEQAGFDAFGNLWWEVSDPGDGVPEEEKTVIFLDGHSDTVRALRPRWLEAIGGGVDAYEGMTDPERVDEAFLREELGYLPSREEWKHLVFGRGSADQLGGVVCQAIATKVLRELRGQGALRGVVVRSYATVAEEDNDGGGPMYLMGKELPGLPPHRLPDVVILSEGTGDAEHGATGIYRGQRGRMQIELSVTGRSCHGSMPWEGLNPLEFGAAIVAEAAAAYDRREGFADHPFLGHGTRTASWCRLETPSDCAVPSRLVVRFDRRLTVGESPESAVADVADLPAVARARSAGLEVRVRVPTYAEPTWRGYLPGNPQIYAGWVTPEEHPAIRAAAAAYGASAGPVVERLGTPGLLRREPRVGRWIFSTDGVGYPVPRGALEVPATKRWVRSGELEHPAIFGIGPGIEQNTHKVGECVDRREMAVVVAVMARFPNLYRALTLG